MSEQAVFDALKYRIEVDEDGSRRYYNTNGELHRTDGPAVEYFNGDRVWFINDEQLSEAEFNQAVKNV